VSDNRSMNPTVKKGDRVRVVNWGDFDKYVGLLGTVRHVTSYGVVTVDLDNDPMTWQKPVHRMGLVFDPLFQHDLFEKIGRVDD
jgi:signal peptidase I